MDENFDPFAMSGNEEITVEETVTAVQDDFDFETEEKPVQEAPAETNYQGGARSRKAAGSYETVTNKRVTWSSTDKAFKIYDGDTRETTMVDPDAEFIYITHRMCVTGAKQVDSGKYNRIYSNEFIDSKNQLVIINEYDSEKEERKEIGRGTYDELRDTVKNTNGASFTWNVYAIERGTDKLVRFEFTRSSRNVGFDIIGNYEHQCFKFGPAEEQKNGAIVFNVPTVEFFEITDEENDKAIELAEQVDAKLNHNRAMFEAANNR